MHGVILEWASVRRRCPYIIVSDASADPNWTFKDLVRAIELVRTDFGAEVDIVTDAIEPDKESRVSTMPYVVGKISYKDGTRSSIMIYIKTTLFPELPQDVYGYHRANKSFPDQSTANQFFDEPQFEAYRELGFQAGKQLFECAKFEKVI